MGIFLLKLWLPIPVFLSAAEEPGGVQLGTQLCTDILFNDSCSNQPVLSLRHKFRPVQGECTRAHHQWKHVTARAGWSMCGGPTQKLSHRIIQLSWFGRDIKDHTVPTPLPWAPSIHYIRLLRGPSIHAKQHLILMVDLKEWEELSHLLLAPSKKTVTEKYWFSKWPSSLYSISEPYSNELTGTTYQQKYLLQMKHKYSDFSHL